MIEITLLGTGGGMPMPNRNLSAALINYLGRKILIDCGEGTQVSMRLANTGFKSIDVICITHTHGDHIIGLPGLLATIGNSGRVDPIHIIGPEGITEAVQGLMVVAKYLPYEVKIIESPNEKLNIIENVEISTLELDHSSPCIGYNFLIKRRPKFDVEKAEANNVPKILWNKLQKSDELIELEGITYSSDMVLGVDRRGIKLSYITDTRPIDEIVDFIKDSDYFICEGTYGEDTDIEKAIKNKHMTFREAATLAKNGNVDTLLLTHFSTAMSDPEYHIHNAREIFINSNVGKDRMKIELNFK